MEKQLVWKQTSKVITQVPLATVISDLADSGEWTPQMIRKRLLEDKKLITGDNAFYHVWRDSLR